MDPFLPKKHRLLSFLIVLFFIPMTLSSQNVNIPDSNFKNILLSDELINTNGDDEIQIGEAAEFAGHIECSFASIFDVTGLQEFKKLKSLNCRNNPITLIPLDQLDSLEQLICISNDLLELNLTSNLRLENLDCRGNELAEIDISANQKLKTLICNTNLITTLDVSGNPNLEVLVCQYNEMDKLILPENSNLRRVICSWNELTEIVIPYNQYLTDLKCDYNNLTVLNVDGLPNLKTIHCGSNLITSLDFSQNLELNSILCQFSKLTSLNVSQNYGLDTLQFHRNEIEFMDLGDKPELKSLAVAENPITTLIANGCPKLNYFACYETALQQLFIKCGNNDFSNYLIFDNPDLQYICADQEDIDFFKENSPTNCEVNSYCSFVPGGEFFLVEGTISYDIAQNNCSSSEIPFPLAEIKIKNVLDSQFYSFVSSHYYLGFSPGEYEIEVTPNNKDFFAVSPEVIELGFPLDSLNTIHDFCISAIDNFHDLEISMVPTVEARPGFIAEYKLTYTNHGTQAKSGTVQLNFQDNYMELVSSFPDITSIEDDIIEWDFENLNPFESRSIYFEMQLNTPTDENYPLNSDDELVFSASVLPTQNDIEVSNNTIRIAQEVVNSFDPNDKTCLEGSSISPDYIGEYVHYVIRFENTGSAEAINIVVKDFIDPSMFDINTLKPLDSSHDYFVTIRANSVEFIFEDIYLPIEDLGNDGYIAFKVRTRDELLLGDQLINNAEIYFDYNAPIITNDAISTFELNTGIDKHPSSIDCKIFPNPLSSDSGLNVECSIESEIIEIYSADGLVIFRFVDPALSKIEKLTKDLRPGIYFLKIFRNKHVSVQKFIKN